MFSCDILGLFDTSFQKIVNSHVFFLKSEKYVKYVFSNTDYRSNTNCLVSRAAGAYPPPPEKSNRRYFGSLVWSAAASRLHANQHHMVWGQLPQICAPKRKYQTPQTPF